MHKTYHGMIPNKTGIVFNRTSGHGVKANIPDVSRMKSKRNSTLMTELYCSTFGSIDAKLWNCLPVDLREIEDQDLFKRKLDLLLQDNRYPRPPPYSWIPGTNQK